MKILIKIFSLILLVSALLSLSSCAKLKQFFGGEVIKDDLPEDGASLIGEIDPRRPGAYNFLFVRESDRAGDALAFMVCQMDLPSSSLSMMQIPADLYIRTENASSLSQIYANGYAHAKSLGFSKNDCAVSAAKTVSEALEKTLRISMDYHIVANKESVDSYVSLLGGLIINLSFDFTTNEGITHPAGSRYLDGDAVANYLEYDRFRDYESEINAARLVLASVHETLLGMLTSENIAVHMVQAKPFFSTDLPTRDGYDIFFLRKLIQVSEENWKITELCTSPMSTQEGEYRVVHYNTALEQLNSFFAMYREDMIARPEGDENIKNKIVLDPDSLLTNKDNIILNAIYKSAKSIPAIYNVADIRVGSLQIFQK